MMNNKECRAFEFELRAEQNEEHGHFVEGRAIVFGQPYDNGWFTEYIESGALDNTDLRDVRLLVNHDTSMIPLARSRNNNANSTMQLSVLAEGMDIRADLDTEGNATAQALYSATNRGDVSGMSFMFTVDKDKWENLDTEHPIRRIESIGKVFEVSAVTWPAYEQTTFEARSKEETLESVETTLENAKRNAEEEQAQIELAKAREERQARVQELKEKLQAIKEA